ncbi:MAG: hypothetical protein ACLU8F_06565 [Clostridia bacterium]
MMYNQSPEEYMRNVLGYMPANTYETDRYVYQPTAPQVTPYPQAPRMESYMENYPTMMNSSVNTMPRIGMQSNPVMPVMENSELEEMYPDIYRLLKPMVEKKCRETTGRITVEVLERMTEEIYVTIEKDENPTQVRNTENKNGDVKNPNAKQENREMETRQRRPNNYLLRDLIKILILNNIIGCGRPPRPVPPPPSPRPPFPGGPRYPSNPNIPPMPPAYPGPGGQGPVIMPREADNRYSNGF